MAAITLDEPWHGIHSELLSTTRPILGSYVPAGQAMAWQPYTFGFRPFMRRISQSVGGTSPTRPTLSTRKTSNGKSPKQVGISPYMSMLSEISIAVISSLSQRSSGIVPSNRLFWTITRRRCRRWPRPMGIVPVISLPASSSCVSWSRLAISTGIEPDSRLETTFS